MLLSVTSVDEKMEEEEDDDDATDSAVVVVVWNDDVLVVPLVTVVAGRTHASHGWVELAKITTTTNNNDNKVVGKVKVGTERISMNVVVMVVRNDLSSPFSLLAST